MNVVDHNIVYCQTTVHIVEPGREIKLSVMTPLGISRHRREVLSSINN